MTRRSEIPLSCDHSRNDSLSGCFSFLKFACDIKKSIRFIQWSHSEWILITYFESHSLNKSAWKALPDLPLDAIVDQCFYNTHSFLGVYMPWTKSYTQGCKINIWRNSGHHPDSAFHSHIMENVIIHPAEDQKRYSPLTCRTELRFFSKVSSNLGLVMGSKSLV